MEREDPVKVLSLVNAVCDACGWHTGSIESKGGGVSAVREFARIHRLTCPSSAGHDADGAEECP